MTVSLSDFSWKIELSAKTSLNNQLFIEKRNVPILTLYFFVLSKSAKSN